MGITFITSEQLLARYGDEIRRQDGVTYSVFKVMVKDLADQFKKQEGRYYVLLSLEEAEHFRGVIHGRKGVTLLPSEQSGALTTGKSHSLCLVSYYSVCLITLSGVLYSSSSLRPLSLCLCHHCMRRYF